MRHVSRETRYPTNSFVPLIDLGLKIAKTLARFRSQPRPSQSAG